MRRTKLILGLILALSAALPAAHADDSYGVALTRYELARIRFMQVQTVAQACHAGCAQSEQLYTRSAGNYLSTAADLLHHHLVRLDEYAKSAGSDKAYAEAHRQIVTLDGEVNETRNMTYPLSGTSPQWQLQAAEEAVQRSWNRVDQLSQSVTGQIVSDNVELSAEQLSQTDKKLHTLRDGLAAQGVNTDRLDALLVDFDVSVHEAQDSHLPGGAGESVLHAVSLLREITKEVRALEPRAMEISD